MNTMELLTGPLAQAVGWALLHLLWQATIVAGILAAVLSLMSRQTASARYVVSCGALSLVFAMFVATTVRAYDPAAAPIVASPTAKGETIQVSLTRIPLLLAETAAVGLRDRAIAAVSSARKALPSIVAIWLAGVVLLSARLLLGWMTARRLAHRGAQPANADWHRVATRLSGALGLRRAVTLLESAAVEVPSVIGTLRPIILLPASALTGLTPEQIEMVLAHELAHIRRHDFLVNLLQAVVETLMFYHPAVWWMSRRVRIERENCCDDLAVAVCGNPIQYARALTRLEELRAPVSSMVVSANGGSLLERIRRIAAGRAEGSSSSPRWAAAVVMLSMLILAVAVPSLPALAQREEKKAEKATPATTSVEVVEPAEESERAEVVTEEPGDVDMSMDRDIDPAVEAMDLEGFDYELVPPAPEPPEPPDWPVAMIAPVAPTPRPYGIPVPMVAPRPMAVPTPMATPRPPRAPMPPTPVAMLADFDFDFDFEQDDDGESDRELGAGGKLTVDELISLRATGVTPAYVNTMREQFPGLTLRQVTSMSAVGVTPEFLREMRDAGFEVKSAREATGLRAVGVTPEWVRELRAAGVKIESAKEASNLRALNVTADFVKRLAKAGYANLTPRELSRLAAAGVDEDFIRDMEQYRKKN
jgi:beta-lactamase regulating signal transducer with metallopeptidase domain